MGRTAHALVHTHVHTHAQKAIAHRYFLHTTCMLYRSLWYHEGLRHKLGSPEAFPSASEFFFHLIAIFLCKGRSFTVAKTFHEAVVSRISRKHPTCCTDFMLSLFLVHLEHRQFSFARRIVLVIIRFNYLQLHSSVGIKVHNSGKRSSKIAS